MEGLFCRNGLKTYVTSSLRGGMLLEPALGAAKPAFVSKGCELLANQ
jgi:hypothetical protein